MVRPEKQAGIGYLLLIFLGGFGAHHFYLGNIGVAITQLLLWWGGWLLSIVLIGWLPIAVVFVWWIVDLFLMPSYVRTANARI